MKKLLTLFAALVLVAISIAAHEIPEDEARAIAMQKFAAMGKTVVNRKIKRAPSKSVTKETAPLYIFNNEEGGFVIVAGDDDIPNPILAYSATSTFDVNDCAPAALAWIEEQECIIRAMQNGEIDAPQPLEGIDFSSPVSPLIKTKWGQGDPYNRQCPTIDGQHCVVGCVATALAQVMKFWEYPKGTGGKEDHSYAWNGQTLTATLTQSIYDWDNMKETYKAVDNRSEAECNAVAKLMSDCGIALDMKYTLKSSSAFTVDTWKVLVKYFGYDDGAHYICSNSMPHTEWVEKVKAELDAGRPVIYSGRTIDNAGHAFVCDGYDSEGLFSINWGWYGKGDEYYQLHILDPKDQGTGGSINNYAFSYNQGALFGIKPPQEGATPTNNPNWFFGCDDSYVMPDNNERTSFTIYIKNIFLYGWSSFNGRIVVTASKDGNETIIARSGNFTLNPNYGWRIYCFNSISSSIITDGTYSISFYAETTNGTRYPIRRDVSFNPQLTISNGKVALPDYMQDYTPEQLASGYAAWELNSKRANETPVWRQNLREDGGDAFPVLDTSHDIVIKATTKGLNSICRPVSGTMNENIVGIYDFEGIYGNEVWGTPVTGTLTAGHPYVFTSSKEYVNFHSIGTESNVTADNHKGLYGVLSPFKNVYGNDNDSSTPVCIVLTASALKYANALQGNTIVYGKCYINKDEALHEYEERPQTENNARRIGSSNVTGIYKVANTDVCQDAYNLQGMRIDENYKGIVIIDGKKVLWK